MYIHIQVEKTYFDLECGDYLQCHYIHNIGNDRHHRIFRVRTHQTHDGVYIGQILVYYCIFIAVYGIAIPELRNSGNESENTFYVLQYALVSVLPFA